MILLPCYHIHITELITADGEETRLPRYVFEQPTTRKAISLAEPSPHDTSTERTSFDARFGALKVHFLQFKSMNGRQPNERSSIYSRFEQVSTFEVPSKASPQTAQDGVVHVPFGIVHLFRMLDGPAESDTDKSLRALAERDEQDVGDDHLGTVLAMLNIPASVTVSNILEFFETALEVIEQVRVIEHEQHGYLMLLLKFRDALDAEQFFKMYNGLPFDGMQAEETCELVYVTGFTASGSTTPPVPYPMSSNLEPWPIIHASSNEPDASLRALRPYQSGSGLRENAFELPTCPVCLDRLDARLSGIITVMCQHTFHCTCLQRWSDSRCPVCRHSYVRHFKGTESASQRSDAFSTVFSNCSACGNQTNLWMWYVYMSSPPLSLTL